MADIVTSQMQGWYEKGHSVPIQIFGVVLRLRRTACFSLFMNGRAVWGLLAPDMLIVSV